MGGVKSNLAGSVYLSLSNVVSQLLVVPFYIQFWGSDMYGGWLVLCTVPVVFSFSDAGLSTTTGNLATLYVHREDYGRAQSLLNAAWKYQGIFCVSLSALLLIGIVTFPIQNWVSLGFLTRRTFLLTSLMLCGYASATVQGNLLAATFRSAGAYGVYLVWNAHARVLETAAVIFGLTFGAGVLSIAAILLVIRLIVCVFLFIKGRRIIPDVELAPFRGRWVDVAPSIGNGFDYLAFPLANSLLNQGAIMLTNHALGPASVVVLSVCRQLTRVFPQAVNLILTAVTPEMTKVCATGDRQKIARLHSYTLAIPLVVTVPFLILSTQYGLEVLHWWTRKEMFISVWMIAVCCLESFSLSFGPLCCLIPWATSKMRSLSITYVCANVTALFAVYILLPRLGVIAVPGAYALAGFYYCIVGIRYSIKISGITLRELITIPVLRDRFTCL